MSRRVALLILSCLFACEGRRDGKQDAQVEYGDCKDDQGAGAADSGDADPSAVSVRAEVTLDTIVLYVDDVDAACEPVASVDVEFGDGVIRVDITDGGASGCSCIRDFTVMVINVEAGDWLVDVYFDGDYVTTAAVTVNTQQ